MSPDFHPLRALDALPQLVWVAGPDGNVEYINRRCAEYTGVPADDLLGWDWGWVIHPEDLTDTLARWTAAVRDSRALFAEHRFRRADGQYRWFLSRGEPEFGADRRLLRWVGTCTDIDESHRAGDAAREDRRLVRAFVERGPGGYALVGADRLVRYTSPWVAAFLGRPPGVFSGTDARDWVHRDDRPRLAAAVSDLLLRPGERVEADGRLLHSDGSFRRVRLRATNLLPDLDVRAVAVAIEPAAGG
ncbi:PAS domain-containing protein [Urbifossiella limnaea]|uniref:histidine kinase n=1 Tax=Urbifossiella limnaea TaxID=2528023 RepID=A0A517XST6_9BACT|nr:PAS domain-containing protein [Urbifossiella limnaea]QDU20552.1 PAS fold protein [Urbifossiella limnaea]